MKTDMQEQWRREYNDYSRKKNPLPNMGGDPCWDSFLKAKQSSQETIEKLQNRNQQLEEFCQEFVYGEENPEYYSTMTAKIEKLQKENKELLEIIETINKIRDNLQDTHTELLRERREQVEMLNGIIKRQRNYADNKEIENKKLKAQLEKSEKALIEIKNSCIASENQYNSILIINDYFREKESDCRNV